jgi:hypothetical protein
MKNVHLKAIVALAAILGCSAEARAQDLSAEQAQEFASEIFQARNEVDFIMQLAGGGGGLLENDNEAAQLCLSASGSLTSGGQSAQSAAEDLNKAKTAPPAVASGLLQQAKFKLVDACVATGWAASDLGSAALASIEPPLGTYTPFHNNIKGSWQRVLTARSKASCP